LIFALRILIAAAATPANRRIAGSSELAWKRSTWRTEREWQEKIEHLRAVVEG
jgi:hypothetical protein